MTSYPCSHRTYFLQHPDGTKVRLSNGKAEWENWDHKRWTEDRPLWHPSAYAARLVRIGFHREEVD